MNEKLKKHLDGIFSPYEDLHAVSELKEELLNDLQEKLSDLKQQGYDEETAYHMTVDSIGDISEIMESITAKTRELKQMVLTDFSKTNLENSDFKGVKVHDGKFNYSALKGSDFSDSDLTSSSFKCSDLREVRFNGADLSRANLTKSDLRNASFNGANLTKADLTMCDMGKVPFNNCIFDNTKFKNSDLSGICFDNQTFNGTIFDYSGLKGTSFKNAVFKNVSFKSNKAKYLKHTIFDGATMDKLTYAVLKGSKADLTLVTVI
ncbi:pentapeptide repeat-containing protein [Virgibacillus sp. DJP39]|uniref:pentapeptide repeat-containing protein n=1 Tax=Virgibacillus sp. DJP39 TaxID=3409790 RepID=UPI003BB6574C